MRSGFAVVIPAYNEAPTIRAVVLGVLAHVSSVILVDDGSNDHTCDQVADLPIAVLKNRVNRGKGASLQKGAAHAFAQGHQLVITIDGDGQHDPADIPRLQAVALNHPGALVIGARGANNRRPKLRYAANRLADWAVTQVAGCPISDSQSGLRIYPRALFERLFTAVADDRFAFETQALIAAAQLGIPFVTVPIAARYRGQVRRSHYRPFVDTAQIGRLLLSEWWRARRGIDVRP
ncbi:MAG: glycosyltransferase family 2 protein [Acidiferrobacter sp.]